MHTIWRDLWLSCCWSLILYVYSIHFTYFHIHTHNMYGVVGVRMWRCEAHPTYSSSSYYISRHDQTTITNKQPQRVALWVHFITMCFILKKIAVILKSGAPIKTNMTNDLDLKYHILSLARRYVATNDICCILYTGECASYRWTDQLLLKFAIDRHDRLLGRAKRSRSYYYYNRCGVVIGGT